uniref:DUF4369 domain-containing protein n=1 Tax=Parastrongyloides trichosuri TaxID=131310 RepID=A0A0N4Z6V5_PARTI
MTGGYSEVLDIMITEVPSFDRPGLNVSVTAKSTNPSTSDIVNKELGFITIKPFLEDTGFAEFDKPKSGPDLVALELSSNTGMLTIEEGVMKKTFNRTLNAHVNMIVMDLKYENDYLNKDGEIKDSKRVFKHISKVLSNGELQEKLLEITAIEKRSGEILRFKKVYKKIFDYLKNY